MTALACLMALLVVAGVAQAIVGLALVRRFGQRVLSHPDLPRTTSGRAAPAISVLKPLFDSEPLLEEALASLCRQQYPRFQVICGVQDPADPAIAVVRRVQARFPGCDLRLVIDPTSHGSNHKVGNLINMMRAAAHDLLVIADADVHAPPGYLSSIAGALAAPGVGLATTLYSGLPASRSLVSALGATAITHGFLPGALMARALGRRDCLGATMALRRETLEALGGFQSIVEDLADDAVLGQRVRGLGLEIALATTVPATTVPETRLAALLSHELRWSRTILSVAPIGFVMSALQFPLAWAVLCLLLSSGEEWGWAVLLLAWAVRAGCALGVDRALRAGRPEVASASLASPAPLWLLPLRDLLSVGIMVASFGSDQVRWRGQVLNVRVRPPEMRRLDTMKLGAERP